MDTSNPTNGTITFSNGSNNSGGNWRNELSNDFRHKIVNKIMDTLQRHMPPTGPDGMNELRKIAQRFEERIYMAAVDQQDYLRKISLKMLSLRDHVSNPPVQVSSSANNQRPPDPAGLGIPSQMRNAPQSPALGNLPQQQQTLLQQNLQNATSGGGIQSTSGLTSTLSSMTSLSQSTSGQVFGTRSAMTNSTGQVFGTQSAMTNSTGQVLSQNPLLASAQRELLSRQQQHPQQVAQQHQLTQAQHQLFYQQNLQHQPQHLQHLQQQALKEKFQQQSQLAISILQQQQPPIMQQSQLQTSQQSILQSAQAPTLQSTQQFFLRQSQPSLQPAQQSALQQTSQSFLQQQHQQSVLRQQQSFLQQQPSVLQQQQPSMMFNVPNMQQQQQQQQLQQIIQYKSSQYQQAQLPSPSLLQAQLQQLQEQLQQQQLLSQLQHQPQQLQQQQSLFPQSNTVQQDLQQRLHTPGGLLQQQQSSVEQQKQLLQAQTQRLSDASTTSMELSGQGGQSTADLQEKIYQKLQNMKDKYSADLKEVIVRLTVNCNQPMQAADQLEKLKNYKLNVQRMLQFFTVAKNNIPPGCPEDKIDAIERQILYILNAFEPVKPKMQQQQGHQQLISQPGSQVHSMQQQSQPPMLQIQQQEKHVNQLQQINLHASVTSMQPNNVTPIQHGSMAQLQQSSVPTTMQNIRTAMQHGASLNSIQGSGISALQKILLQHSNSNINGPLQNNGAFQQNSMSSLQQSGNNPLQQNDLNHLQLNANVRYPR